MTVAITCMLLVNGPLPASAAAGSFGIAMGGTAPLQTIAWARYYGRRALGAITGVATLIGIVNAVLGPIMPSLVFDATGSYHGAFVATGIACVAGIALFALAGAPGAPRVTPDPPAP